MVRNRRRHTAALKFRVALEPLDRKTWRLMRNGSDFLRALSMPPLQNFSFPRGSVYGNQGRWLWGMRVPIDRILQGVID